MDPLDRDQVSEDTNSEFNNHQLKKLPNGIINRDL